MIHSRLRKRNRPILTSRQFSGYVPGRVFSHVVCAGLLKYSTIVTLVVSGKRRQGDKTIAGAHTRLSVVIESGAPGTRSQ